MKTTTVIVCCLLLVPQVVPQGLPSGNEVLQRVEKATEGVNDYEVKLQADVHLERVRIPRASATMYFKKPDKIHFDSPGITMMPREGIAINSAALLEQYSAQMVGEDTAHGMEVYKMQLAAKSASARLRQLFVWVNPQRWTIVRMQTIPYEGRVLTMDFQYGLQEGKYWMPVFLTAQFELTGDRQEASSQPDSTQSRQTPLDEMQPHAPRSGSIAIAFTDYRINVGLSDDLFRDSR